MIKQSQIKKLLIILYILLPCNIYAVSDAFLKDCRSITGTAHRLTGTQEYNRAAEYIKSQLNSIGMDKIFIQKFPTGQLFVNRCEIQVQSGNSSRRLNLFPVRPNGIMPPVTSTAGITGILIYAGNGEIENYNKKSPKGCIVVLDYNAEDWMTAFRLGAKAVIFARKGQSKSYFQHNSICEVNIPRFYYNGNPDDLTENKTATIYSEVVWKTVQGQNIFAFIRGTGPVFDMKKEELVIIAANLDSYGEVPQLSPGARSAANCAGLLKLAKYFKDNPAKRHILIAFFDAQSKLHTGAIEFYKAIETEVENISIVKRQEYIDNEKKFLGYLLKIISNKETAAKEICRDIGLVTRFKEKAANYTTQLTYDRLGLLKQRTETKDKNSEEYKIIKSKIADCEAEKDRWNNFKRGLTRDAITEDSMKELNILMNEVEFDIKDRVRELREEQEYLNMDAQLNRFMKEYWVSLHLSLFLGDTSNRFALVLGGNSGVNADYNTGLFSKIQNVFIDSYKSTINTVPINFELASVDGTFPDSSLLLATGFVHSGEIAAKSGIFNAVLATCQEYLPREGTPDDTPELLDLEKIDSQVSDICPLLHKVVNHPGLSLKRVGVINKLYYNFEFNKNNKMSGPSAMGKTKDSSVANKAMKDTTVQLIFGGMSRNSYAFDNFQVLRTNNIGSYSFNCLATPVGFAIKSDEHGVPEWISNQESAKTAVNRINMLRMYNPGFVMLPPVMVSGIPPVVYDGLDSAFDPAKTYFESNKTMASWYAEEKTKRIKLFSPGIICLLNNDQETMKSSGEKEYGPSGIGYKLNEIGDRELAMSSAEDLWRLNESRLQILRSRNVMNSSLEELHGRADDFIRYAKKAVSFGEREALSISAFMLENFIYSDIRATFNDLISAVLLLLAFSIPFAFALERLVIGSNTIYKQIMWFVIFFTGTFAIIYFSHPAFAISNTPIIIFLGFTIITLSALVIFIIMQKFEIEMKKLQGLTSTVHSVDVSRFSTMLVAMKMGISTMRRRPLRTALTTITITLLTFTILFFASFGIRLGIVKLYNNPLPKYTGVMVRQVNRSALNREFVNVIKNNCIGYDILSCPRYWAYKVMISRKDASKPVNIKGVLGIDYTELKCRQDLKEIINTGSEEDFSKTIWMTKPVATRLNVVPGEEILLNGIKLTVGNIISTDKLVMIEDMDRSRILPVDFEAVSSFQQGAQSQEKSKTDEKGMTQLKQDSWISLPIDSVVIVPAKVSKQMGSSLHAVTLYTHNTDDAVNIAENLARILQIPISATRPDGVYFQMLGTIVQASGAKDLFFPILLGGLVIFGTMLGSVADREREIYTFSSLGLAPSHITGLFVSEAMVYSIIGGFGGYLLAQVSMKFMFYLANLGIIRMLEINYSSTNTVTVLMIIMATVLISSIYPAIKAAASVNTGILSSWKPPEPDGNVFNIVFPFTVSEYDMTGIVSFLKEHFDTYKDVGLGIFMADETKLIQGSDKKLGLHAKLALAPFDLGVTEYFDLSSQKSEIENINEVMIKITYISGEPKDWKRLNKILLNDLRKQFLIWRSLKSEVMEIYRHRTLTEI